MPKKKRVSHDNAFKIPVIEYAEKFGNRAAGRKYGVCEASVRQWRKFKSNIFYGAKNKKRIQHKSRCWYKELEGDLSVWLGNLHQSGKTVSKDAIRMKARQLAKDVKYGAGLFKASYKWCKDFMNRQGFHMHQRSHIAQEEDKQEMELGVNDKLVTTDIDNVAEDIVIEKTNDFKVALEEYQIEESDDSVTGDDDDDVTFDIYIEDTEMDITDENKENVVCDEADSDQEVIIEPQNTESVVIETIPKYLPVSETVLNKPFDTESGNPDEEVMKTPADPKLTSNKRKTKGTRTFQKLPKTEVSELSDNSKNVLSSDKAPPEVDKNLEGVANEQNQSDYNTSSENQSGNRKSVASLDDMVGVEIKQEPLYSTDEVRVAGDEIYHITMLVSSEQEDAIRLLFRKKHWSCLLKVLSDENIAGLLDGGYNNIFPLMEKQKEMKTNTLTEIQSQVSDVDGGHCINQSFTALKLRKASFTDENADSSDSKMIEEQHASCLKFIKTENTKNRTEPSFNIIKRDSNQADEIEDNDCSIYEQSSDDSDCCITQESIDDTNDTINGHTNEDTNRTLNGHSRDVNDGTINGESRDDESTEKSKNRFHCWLCDTPCTTNIMLKKHFEQHPNGLWLDFYCKDCFERFKTRKELTKHRKIVKHAPNKNLASKKLNTPEDLVAMGQVQCEVCGNFYSHKRSLRRHMIDEHEDAVPKYSCGVCAEEFDLCAQLHQHMRETGHRTSISQLGNYLCDSCGKMYKGFDCFRQHKEYVCMFTGRKNTPCDICGLLFQSKIRVRKHKSVVHEVSPMVCDVCGYTCKNKIALRLHKHRHNPKNRRFKCDACSKSFFNNSLLKEHKRTHTKEKPFKCPICIYRCAIKQNLHKHVRNVHKTKLME